MSERQTELVVAASGSYDPATVDTSAQAGRLHWHRCSSARVAEESLIWLISP